MDELGEINELLRSVGTKPIQERSESDRIALAQLFIEKRIIEAKAKQRIWGRFTKQTIQVKGSRLAEHLVSIVTGIPGRGSTGTGGGPDLSNGEEIKSANRISQKGGMTDSHILISFKGDEEYFRNFLSQKRLWFVFFDVVNGRIRVQIWTIDPSSSDAREEFEDWKSIDHNWEYGKINLRIYQNGTTHPLHPRFAGMNPLLVFKAVENDKGEAEILVFDLDGVRPPDLPE